MSIIVYIPRNDAEHVSRLEDLLNIEKEKVREDKK